MTQSVIAALILLTGLAGGMEPDTTEAGSLTLAEVVASALETHPAVAGAEARLDAAAAMAGEARAARFPTVTTSLVATQHQEPMVVAPLHGFDIRSPPQFDETLYQGHAIAEYTLFDGGARGARIEAAASLEAAAASSLAGARAALLADATSAYLGALTARTVLRAHEQRVRALEEQLGRSRLLFEEGSTARLAVLRTEAALSRARAEREAADQGLQLALRRLARISGLEEARVRDAALAPIQVRDDALPARAVLVERARAHNPGLQQAADRVAAAETGVSAARSSYLPRVSLSGRYTAYGAGGVDPTGEWQAGVRLSYPLFTGGARIRGVERARAEAVAARSERRLAEQRIEDAVDGALLAHRSARARVEALRAAVEQSAEVARIEALALESGSGVHTDYLQAEAELLGARSALAEARNALIEARVQLARATGALTREWLVQMTERAEP